MTDMRNMANPDLGFHDARTVESPRTATQPEPTVTTKPPRLMAGPATRPDMTTSFAMRVGDTAHSN